MIVAGDWPDNRGVHAGETWEAAPVTLRHTTLTVIEAVFWQRRREAAGRGGTAKGQLCPDLSPATTALAGIARGWGGGTRPPGKDLL